MSEYEIFCGDCMEFMKTIKGKHIDAVITDPPYGVSVQHVDGKMGGWSKDTKRWSNQINPIYPAFTGDDKPIDPEELLNIGEKHIIWGGNFIADKLPPERGWLIWYKRIKGQQNDQGDCELAWTDLKIVPRVYQHLWMGMLRDSESGDHWHPTQKPVSLMKWCLEFIGKPGATIFDPYMGSGSTGVACMEMGYNFIGCEIVPEIFETAKKRISLAKQQLNLFEGI